MNESITLTSLPRRLVEKQVFTEAEALRAVSQAKEKNQSFFNYALENNLLPSKILAENASIVFGLPLLDLSQFDAANFSANFVDEKLITKYHAIPLLKKGKRLYIAISDPSNLNALTNFKFHTGLITYPILVEADKLSAFIEKLLSEATEAALGDLDDAGLDTLDFSSEQEDDDKVLAASEVDDAPIVRFVHKILLDAIKKGVSDVHFEPYEKQYRIRVRRDGILYEIASPPLQLSAKIAARLKIMARLDISERRVPQDGHFSMALSKTHAINFRVNTCPTTCGEKVVVRLLDPAKLNVAIENLGYDKFQQDLLLRTINRSQGMLLVTGPTGSGKTVSLYTALHILNTQERNISTVEDPVEIHVQGINQVNINIKAGLDFASALRAFLRQDPDVIMVGEIRDLETAEIAIKAAQTGHLVLSTLHTNSATESLTRLANMGIPHFNIATSINLIVAQRLVRCLCRHCKQEESLPSTAMLEAGFLSDDIDKNPALFKPDINGCKHCKNGYSGRIGIYEVLPVTPELSTLIMDGGHAIALEKLAIKQGLQTLRRSGLMKVLSGITSLEEVNRVI